MRRSTWILLLVFGLLVVFAWLFQRYQANKPDTSPTTTPIPTAAKLFSLTNLLVSELMIVDNQGNQVDLYRDQSTSNNWAVRDMPTDQADKVGIETAISDLLSIQIIDRLTEILPLHDIGLATPVYTLTLTTTDGRHIITEVGDKTPVGTGYYIRLDSGPVVIVDNITLDEVLSFVKKPPLLVTPTSEVTVTEVGTGTVTGTGTPIAPDITVTPTP